MRRIIERTLTVVTTTTWRISWQEDGLASAQADPDPKASAAQGLSRRTVQTTRRFPATIKAKEADTSGTEVTRDKTNPPTHDVPENAKSHLSMKGDQIS